MKSQKTRSKEIIIKVFKKMSYTKSIRESRLVLDFLEAVIQWNIVSRILKEKGRAQTFLGMQIGRQLLYLWPVTD